MSKVLDVTESKILEVSKELTIAWIQKYGNNSSFYPEPEQIAEAFDKIYKASLKTIDQ